MIKQEINTLISSKGMGKSATPSSFMANLSTFIRQLKLCFVALVFLSLPSSEARAYDVLTETLLPEQLLTHNSNLFGHDTFQKNRGIATVNAISGDLNQVASQTAIAFTLEGLANATVTTNQLYQSLLPKFDQVARAVIQDNAFNGVSGLTSISQIAGGANSQSNSAAFAIGLAGGSIANDVLAQSKSLVNPHTRDEIDSQHAGRLTTGVSPLAFQGAQGVVQLSQIAGSGNLTGNRFTMEVLQ